MNKISKSTLFHWNMISLHPSEDYVRASIRYRVGTSHFFLYEIRDMLEK